MTTKKTDEQESGSRKREKNGSFRLKHVQGLKDSAAHPYPDFPQVPPIPHPPRTPTQERRFLKAS